MALLEVEDLSVKFYTEDGVVDAVNGPSYTIERGEKFGVVGESGAGKSVTALSLMRLIDSPGRIESGRIEFKGRDILGMDESELRSLRGNEIAMVFQDAQTALNPVYTVGEQIAEAVRLHLDYDSEEARRHTIEMLERVGIPDPADRYTDYPHQFSGGMQQRAMIAMALSCDPDLLICDEPTTALDVTIEAQILELLSDLAEQFDTAIQLITHDLGVVAEVCDRVMVMYAGKPVEKGAVEDIYYDPQHPYTVGLMSSIPRLGAERERLEMIPGTMPDLIQHPPGCDFHPRCPFAEDVCTQTEPQLVHPETGELATRVGDDRGAACLAHTGDLSRGLGYEILVGDDELPQEITEETETSPPTKEGEPLIRAENLTKHYPAEDGFLDKLLGKSGWIKALDGVDLEIREGETLGVVGESGCGKSTLGRTLLQLEEPTEGRVYYDDRDLTRASSNQLREYRKDLQYIFQNPFASLNPRFTIADIIGEPLDIHGVDGGTTRAERIHELLETVGLKPSHANRYPHEFSGGQRQRISIARALAVEPRLIVCDEPVSALDVSVQAQILNLLEDLQDEFGLSYIVIAHDLSVVEHIADRIAVMYLGDIVELGTTEEVFSEPYHPYTESLLSAIPEPDPLWEPDRILLEGTIPSPISPPEGCKFHTRCPQIIQPDGYEFEQSTWRAVMNLRTRLHESDIETVVAPGERADDVELDEIDVPDEIRTRYDLPETLADPGADEVLTETIEHIESGDREKAVALLDEEFSTPCLNQVPDLASGNNAQPIACHLFDERYSELPERQGSKGRSDGASDYSGRSVSDGI